MKEKKPLKPANKKNIIPPVVVVLGHVDHGKTTLLDAIRKTDVAASEAGGITQHIGAYQVQINKSDPNSLITFIDTPGHEAFTKMRSRGTGVADVAILVVAANEGVKPQTKEAIQLIKSSKLPYLIALNKMDLEGINLEIAKSELAQADVFVEGYGGDIVAIPISAKQKKGIDELLDMLNLLYEMQEPKPQTQALKAVVLESYIDPHKGVIANILIRSGELSLGQTVYVDSNKAKVRSLMNDKGEFVQFGKVSQPLQLLGFKEVLPVGSVISDVITPKTEVSIEPNQVQESDAKRLKIILKADVAGTLEAIKASITKEIELVAKGVGDINESDILLAASTGARLIGFHVPLSNRIKKLAEMENVKIQTFDIIYHLLEDLQQRVLKLMEPTIDEEILGKAKIIAEFHIKGSHIAGCKVIEGRLSRSEKVRIEREGQILAQPRIGVMQINREETSEAKKDQEVALVFRPDVKFKLDDMVISYRVLDQ